MAYGGLRGAVGFSLIYILFDEDPSPTNRSRLIKIFIYPNLAICITFW